MKTYNGSRHKRSRALYSGPSRIVKQRPLRWYRDLKFLGCEHCLQAKKKGKKAEELEAARLAAAEEAARLEAGTVWSTLITVAEPWSWSE